MLLRLVLIIIPYELQYDRMFFALKNIAQGEKKQNIQSQSALSYRVSLLFGRISLQQEKESIGRKQNESIKLPDERWEEIVLEDEFDIQELWGR